MKIKSFFQNKALLASISLVVGVGLAISGSVGSYIVGIFIMLPIGIALYKNHSSIKQ